MLFGNDKKNMVNERLLKKDLFVSKIIKKLNQSYDIISSQWINPTGTKTRHFVLDGLLPKADIDEIYNAFPRDGNGFFDRESFREKKRTSADLSEFDEILSDITSTGETLRANNLRVLKDGNILKSTAILMFNKKLSSKKGLKKILNILSS